MPLTFPSHPAAIVPLKLSRPRWFDGTALIFGSMAPDLAYVLDGSGLPVWPFSHQLPGLVGWCLPIAWVCTWTTRRAAPVIAAHLPAGGALALRDYACLSLASHRWWITVTSALTGAASHLALDRLELQIPAAEYVMHLLGAIGMLLLARHIGKHQLLRRWYGDPPARRARPVLFWSVTAVVAVPAIAVTPFLPGASLAHTTGARLLCAVTAGLLLASAAAAIAVRDRRSGWVPGRRRAVDPQAASPRSRSGSRITH
ncbi:protein of unknown function [Micromonospora pallida]|uniref:DUF4184 family protein n=1 Tax=Micromonospora pallida TaxID=145854 RepID=A0A1C6S7G9_9ACTN|nr:DUF4184 family protein [Micromonospora pallida]SCL25237.1 protein of unknown function [Micromonospora pallida]